MADRLSIVNDAQRDADSDADDGSEQSKWLALESNPEAFTSFARRSGLPEPWCFQDIFGLDPELLQMVPQPTTAVILLFPCTPKIFKFRAAEETRLEAEAKAQGCALNELTKATQAAYHLEQNIAFGNACGTIAAVHAITNADLDGSDAGALAAFRLETEDLSADERGRALLSAGSIKDQSDDAAEHVSSQTETPDRDGADLDHHYCAFTAIRTTSGELRIVELDGTKPAAVDHGRVPDDSLQNFLAATAKVIQANFFDADPEILEFNMMALCKPQ